LKRALTDPRIVSGIGNAYSDEILHAARLSPVTQTRKLSEDEWKRLYAATRDTLQRWMDQTSLRGGNRLPRKSDSISRRDGCAWPLWQALSEMWREDSAHSLRRQ